MKSKPLPSCRRCGCNPGGIRWVAATQAAKVVVPEILLCERCVLALRSFFANGKNCPVAVAGQPDRFASQTPPPGSSKADAIPVRLATSEGGRL